MVQLWRIQQSQAIIAIFFWGLTLAGVYYKEYFHPQLVRIGLLREQDLFLGTILLSLAIIATFLLAGLVYDRTLKLWREQTDVIVERNPYSKERLMPKEVMFWKRGTVSILKELAKNDSELKKDIEFMEKWIEKTMEENKEIKKGVEDLERWVMS